MAAPNNRANEIITNVIPHLRHSCEYNCIVRYTVRRGEVINVTIMAVKYIPTGTELTLPFRNDFMESVVELECAEHDGNMSQCPMEQRRRAWQNGQH